ncbi:MAG: hypothetical protein ACRDL8_11900 [Solirubrobacteraceae bacterium]
MQREKAISEWGLVDWELVDPPAFDEPPEPADDGLPLHAAASRARAAVAMTAAAVRALGDPARRGRRLTRVPWFIMASSGVGSWLRLVVDAQSVAGSDSCWFRFIG